MQSDFQIKSVQMEPSSDSPQAELFLPRDCLDAVILPLWSAGSQCSNKTFRHLLSVMDHLSHLPGARSVFLSQLSWASDQICEPLIRDLDALLALMQETTDEVRVQKVTLEYFTPQHATQAKLLRLLKTVDFLLQQGQGQQKTDAPSSSSAPPPSASVPSSSSSAAITTKKEETVVSPIINNQEKIREWVQKEGFTELWKRLNQCLTMVQQHQSLLFVATVLLPLIECLMIVCKYRMEKPRKEGDTALLKEGESTKSTATSSSTTTTPNHEDDLFFTFTEKHRKLLNTLVKNMPKLLRGSFALLVHNPKVLEFDNKRHYFNQQLHKKPTDQRTSVIHVNVRRKYIFQDSFYQLQNRTGRELRFGKLSVRFHGEEAADYGGPTREWYQELTKEMFNPNYALFTPSAEKMGVTYQPNPSSWVNPSHLLYFKFVGRVIGKAIYDGNLLECYFTRSFYKHMLGMAVDVSDMEAVDPEYHKSLLWILENSINDVLDLTFSTEMEEFGQQKVVDLKPNGRNIPVTDDNKHEYTKLIVENRLTTAIKDQIHHFLEGFHDIIPRDLITIFNEKELELLISGVPDLDLDDWKNNTEYRGYTSTSPQIQWFWRCLRSFDQEERAKLLQFATGTSKVPLEGFQHLQGIGGKQRFQIHKDFGSVDRLPSAHTCFNQIDLPVYDSYEQLRERLYKAITEAATGFGME